MKRPGAAGPELDDSVFGGSDDATTGGSSFAAVGAHGYAPPQHAAAAGNKKRRTVQRAAVLRCCSGGKYRLPPHLPGARVAIDALGCLGLRGPGQVKTNATTGWARLSDVPQLLRAVLDANKEVAGGVFHGDWCKPGSCRLTPSAAPLTAAPLPPRLDAAPPAAAAAPAAAAPPAAGAAAALPPPRVAAAPGELTASNLAVFDAMMLAGQRLQSARVMARFEKNNKLGRAPKDTIAVMTHTTSDWHHVPVSGSGPDEMARETRTGKEDDGAGVSQVTRQINAYTEPEGIEEISTYDLMTECVSEMAGRGDSLRYAVQNWNVEGGD
jgi:hypothetical protein